MASIEGGGDTGHKKRTWCKKGQEIVYKSRHDTHGGPWVPSYHVFYFYGNDEFSEDHGPEHAEGYG